MCPLWGVENEIDSKWSTSQLKNTSCFMSPSLEGAFACKCLKCPSPLLVSGFGVSYKIIIQLKGLILPIFLDPGHCPNASGDLILTVFSY